MGDVAQQVVETAMTTTSTLSGRDRAILHAVAAAGAQLQLGAEPDLLFDGRSCAQ
jgi:predicted ATPase